MKEADYAVVRGSKIQRSLSFLILIVTAYLQISGNIFSLYHYKHLIVPVFATAMIWFPDALGSSSIWRNGSKNACVIGWIVLLVYAVFVIL